MSKHCQLKLGFTWFTNLVLSWVYDILGGFADDKDVYKKIPKKRYCREGTNSKKGFKATIKHPFLHLWYLIISHLHHTF